MVFSGALLWLFLALFAAAGGLPAFAQAGDGGEGTFDEDVNRELPIQSEWAGMGSSGYADGDKVFLISLGTLFPLAFTGRGYRLLDNKVSTGGVGILSYLYFINPSFFLGGELGGSFSSTIGENYLFLIPINLRFGYQFLWRRFEFPVSAGLGGAIHSYRSRDLFGLFAKFEAAAFYRFNNDWSFGLSTAFWWCPEWTTESEHDAYGHFLSLTASARYHF
ncbi:MAG: hypothetical protein LBS82_01335 [Spirochaetaceae bacterium]|jgi:hypothetical protein|nr:hypothetical protein [Spirochaetaceae bacterium]